MSRGPMADALGPLRARMAPLVREREILRVAALMPHPDTKAVVDRARHEILRWAQKRSSGQLPKLAWDGQSFEYFAGGRTTFGVRLLDENADLWALRGDDPDKQVAGRTWTTELVMGRSADQVPRISLRLLVSTAEEELNIEPHVPGLLQQISNACGLRLGEDDAIFLPRIIKSDDEFDHFLAMLESRNRRVPIIVASGDERTERPDEPIIDADLLARATLGISHVFILPSKYTYNLSDAVGSIRSVYHGAVRVYMPGFDSAAEPYDHRLILPDTVRKDPGAVVRGLRVLAATESLRRTRLGHDVLPFAAVRTVALRIEQDARASAGASDAEQLDAARRSLEALAAERDAAKELADTSLDLAYQEQERANTAEARLRGALARVEQLKAALLRRGQDPDGDVRLPESWEKFADWCDEALAGRLVLSPAARTGIKKAEFSNVGMAARSLLWLAGTCRDRRMNGGGSLANKPIEQGIENAPCGADTFKFEFHGDRLDADWHVKSGGNTRDPARCLRIYYTWDQTTQQIIVADMPAHRRTGAT
jgi:hypothetical protein